MSFTMAKCIQNDAFLMHLEFLLEIKLHKEGPSYEPFLISLRKLSAKYSLTD